MSAKSKIEWTDATWNPVRGCTKISAQAVPIATPKPSPNASEASQAIRTSRALTFAWCRKSLPEPLTWAKPKMIFVNSMSDLFHKDVADDYILAVAKVMEMANWHTYQVLTKRSERMRDLLSTKLKDAAALPHIWWGVSVENKKHGLPRIDHLRQAPAAVRFLSIEPLLEDLGPINLEGISWVIVRRRKRSRVRGRWRKSGCCRSEISASQAQVPFFFKQWGGWNKKAAGRILEGRTYDEMPPRVSHPVPEKKERLAMEAMFAKGAGKV